MLTNERLEEIVSGQNTVSIPEAVELARELLAIREAGDEEVDALINKILRHEIVHVDDGPVPTGAFESFAACVENLSNIVRRFAASREEMVGLLKYLFRNQDLQSYFDRAILSDEARRILEIVEGEVNGH